MLSEGIHVTLGTDIAAGASLAGNRMVTMSIQASKIRSFTEPSHPAFLTVSEAYYLGTTSGHRYFGAGSGFAPGDRLHAVVVDDRDFTETPWTLSLPERLERALYTMNAANVSAVWSEGRLVHTRETLLSPRTQNAYHCSQRKVNLWLPTQTGSHFSVQNADFRRVFFLVY